MAYFVTYIVFLSFDKRHRTAQDLISPFYYCIDNEKALIAAGTICSEMYLLLNVPITLMKCTYY